MRVAWHVHRSRGGGSTTQVEKPVAAVAVLRHALADRMPHRAISRAGYALKQYVPKTGHFETVKRPTCQFALPASCSYPSVFLGRDDGFGGQNSVETFQELMHDADARYDPAAKVTYTGDCICSTGKECCQQYVRRSEMLLIAFYFLSKKQLLTVRQEAGSPAKVFSTKCSFVVLQKAPGLKHLST